MCTCVVCVRVDKHCKAVDAKEAKRETLLEIVHFVIACPNCLTSEIYLEIRKMIDANVWRPLHPKVKASSHTHAHMMMPFHTCVCVCVCVCLCG